MNEEESKNWKMMTRTNIFVTGRKKNDSTLLNKAAYVVDTTKVILQNYNVLKGLSNKVGQRSFLPIASVISDKEFRFILPNLTYKRFSLS